MSRRFGLVPATLLVVASMIGGGVFTTTGFLLRDVGSPMAVLAAWALGGVLALSGALTYAELAAALPENGGEYQLLSRIYRPSVGFVAGWVSLVVGFAAPIAAVAIAFGRYVAAVVPAVPPDVAAISAIVVLSGLHAARVSVGARVHTWTTIAEVLLILAFVAGGLWVGAPGRVFLTATGPPLSRALSSPGFAIGLVYVSFSYSGWNAAAYVAGEVERPSRTLPLSLCLGAGLVSLLYLGLNLVFLLAAPPDDVKGVLEIAHVAAVHLFGPRAARALSAVIALCLLSSIGAQLVTGARVYEAMGRDYTALRVLARRGRETGPVAGFLFQAAAATVLALTASFDALLTYVGFTLSLSALLAVLGVFVLRFREPTLARPYRTWGYPATPLLAAVMLSWMIARTVVERPLSPVAGLATIAVGAVLYRAIHGARRPAAPSGVTSKGATATGALRQAPDPPPCPTKRLRGRAPP